MNTIERNYLEELLKYSGLELKPDQTEAGYYVFGNADEIPYAKIEDGGYRAGENIPSEIEYAISDAVKRAYDFKMQYERAETMDSFGVSGYRKIGDYGQTVLAAKLMKDSSTEYVVWNYDANRKGVNQGAYCSHLEIAKQILIERAGILPLGYKMLNVTEFIKHQQMKENEELVNDDSMEADEEMER